jgi:hypothetical protein
MSWLSNRVLLLKNRYVPILMLWVVLGGVAQSVSFIWARVYTGTESTGINIEAFGDGRVPVILAIGLGLLLVLFAVLERVGLTGTADRERVQKFFDCTVGLRVVQGVRSPTERGYFSFSCNPHCNKRS